MIRGVRGATTVLANLEMEMVDKTEILLKKMIEENQIDPFQVASIFISVTEELNAAFPAKALRRLPDWTFVPVMCMREIPVPNSLPSCIRVMIHVNTEIPPQEIKHIYLEDAISLRPDLQSN